MKRKATVTGANTVFFVFVVLFIVFQIILAFISGIVSFMYGSDYAKDFLNRNIFPITLFTQFVIILLPVLVYSRVKRFNFKEVFKLRAPGILPSLIIILSAFPAYMAAVMLNSVVIYLLQFIGNIPNQPIPVPQNIPELIIGILVIAVTPGICEEALHRGLLLSAYENRGSMKAVVITSLFFGIFHFDITNLLGPIFLGLLIGYYVIRTNSIFAGVLAHFLNNTIAEVLQYIWRNSVSRSDTINIAFDELMNTFLWGIIGLVALGLLVTAFKKVTNKTFVPKPSISGAGGDARAVISHWPVIVVLVLYFIMLLLFIMTIITIKYFPG